MIEDFVAQCGAGLPSAVTLLAHSVVEAGPGRRDCAALPADGLRKLLADLLSGVLETQGGNGRAIGLDDVITASAEVRAPWLINTTGLMKPVTASVVEGMRRNLWGTAPAEVAPSVEPFLPAAPVLHRFLAAALTDLLARRRGGDGLLTYEETYRRLLGATVAAEAKLPPDEQHPERIAYCHLAMGNVKNAANILTAQFNVATVPTSQWIRMLCLAAQAPCPIPRSTGIAEAFADSVEPGVLGAVDDVERSVTRLLTALWLADDIWTVPRRAPGGGVPRLDERLPWIPDAILTAVIKDEAGFLFGRSARGDRQNLARFMELFDNGRPSPSAGRIGAPSASGWWRRRRLWQQAGILTSGIALVVAGMVPVFAPKSPCGAGLRYNSKVKACVGLDIESSGFVSHDPLSDLEKQIKKDNDQIDAQIAEDNAGKSTDPEYSVSLVFLQEMTPNASSTITIQAVRNALEGAIAQTELADADAPNFHSRIRFKLLLANFGANAGGEQDAVAEIRAAAKSQRIAAVAGIGQSLDATHDAILRLTSGPGEHLTVVGSDVSADTIGLKNPNGSPTDPQNVIDGFYRVVGTNDDEAAAAAHYMQPSEGPQPTVVMIQDGNGDNTYSASLAQAFEGHEHIASTLGYSTDPDHPDRVDADFEAGRTIFCDSAPDFTYFAGRGTDLKRFLTVMKVFSCKYDKTYKIVTGDDGTNLIDPNNPLPTGAFSYSIVATALATTTEWTGDSPPAKAYHSLAGQFSADGFSANDMQDGLAMVSADSVGVLTYATTLSPSVQDAALNDPGAIGGMLQSVRCGNSYPGASGYIEFNQTTHDPIDKAMPLVQISTSGAAEPTGQIAYPAGGPLDYSQSACH